MSATKKHAASYPFVRLLPLITELANALETKTSVKKDDLALIKRAREITNRSAP